MNAVAGGAATAFSAPDSTETIDLFSDLCCSLIIFCFHAGGGLLLSVVVVGILMGMIETSTVGVVEEVVGSERS